MEYTNGVDTAVSIAVIAVAVAVCIVAILWMVVLGYLLFILKNVLEAVRRVKKSSQEISSDVRGAIVSALAYLPRFISGARSRKKKSD